MECTILQEKYQKLEQENNELIDRWKQLKEKEIEELNLQTEQQQR